MDRKCNVTPNIYKGQPPYRVEPCIILALGTIAGAMLEHCWRIHVQPLREYGKSSQNKKMVTTYSAQYDGGKKPE